MYHVLTLLIQSIGRTVTIAEPSVRPILSSVPMCRASSEIQCAYLPDGGFSALNCFSTANAIRAPTGY